MSTGQQTPGADGRDGRHPGIPDAGTAPTSPTAPAAASAAPGSAASGTAAARTPGTATGTQGTPADVPPSSVNGRFSERAVTRTGVIWVAVVAALVLLILLIIFILQNQEVVLVKFLGLEGSVPLGMALFIASVTGGVLVAAAGGARILQLRASARRARPRQRR